VLICVNTPAAPGQMREVTPEGVCPNFCARRAKPSPRVTPPPPPNDQVRHIALTRGKFALVDAWNYEWLNRYRWFAMQGDRTYYATRNDPERGTVLMHREILRAPKGVPVDHINGYGLNNRQSNLRLCTPGQNNCNRGRRRHSSQFTGVCWHKQARDRKALELHGEFAWLNFPEEHPARSRHQDSG